MDWQEYKNEREIFMREEIKKEIEDRLPGFNPHCEEISFNMDRYSRSILNEALALAEKELPDREQYGIYQDSRVLSLVVIAKYYIEQNKA